MFWGYYRPWLRQVLLSANILLPPLAILNRFSSATLLAAVLCAHGLLLFAILHPRCPWLGPVIRSFRTDRRAVWLTIDDGPDGAQTVRLAEELQRRGVRATFFVIGEKLTREPGVERALAGAGHTMANHTATHPRRKMWRLRGATLAAEVDGGVSALRSLGLAPIWFRPPVGHKPPGLAAVLAARGLRQIGWTAGGRDGHDADVRQAARRIHRAMRPGGILLLHECRAHSFETILAVVDAMQSQGFNFVVPADEDLAEVPPAREN